MRKNVRVSYPKRRLKLDATKITGISEPSRKTLYHTSLENFHLVNRSTFLHRVIYAGEHYFPKADDLIVDVFRAIIDQVNEDYNLEKLSGFFVYYMRHFVHMVEGDEDSLNKHIRILLYGNEYTKYLGTIKLVVHVSHVSRRLISGWNNLYGTPAKLLGELELDSSLEDSGRRIYSCIKKIYRLVTVFLDENCYLSDSDKSKTESDDTEITSKTLQQNRSSMPPSASTSGLSITIGSSLKQYPYRPFLPEMELLDFILRSPFTMLLADYYHCYGAIPQRDILRDKVWPIPTDNIPYDVFQKVYDAITELPKPKPQIADDILRHVIFQEDKSEHLLTDQDLAEEDVQQE